MKKVLLTFLFLFLTSISYAGPPPRILCYTIVDTQLDQKLNEKKSDYTKEKKILEKALNDGWKLFNELSSNRMGDAVWFFTDKITEAHCVVYYKGNSKLYPGSSATTSYNYRVYIFWSKFQYDTVENQRRIIAHELMHYIFWLEDEYPPFAEGVDCVMGDQVYKQKKPHLCLDCQHEIDAIFESLGKKHKHPLAEK